jgi:hypothetical protein
VLCRPTTSAFTECEGELTIAAGAVQAEAQVTVGLVGPVSASATLDLVSLERLER